MFHIQYWYSFIILKGIHLLNILSSLIRYESIILNNLDKFLHEGMGILNFRSFRWVFSWYIFVVHTFYSIL